MFNPPFNVGELLINRFDYKPALIDNVDYRNGSWYCLLNKGDERVWLAASTIVGLGYIPFNAPSKLFKPR